MQKIGPKSSYHYREIVNKPKIFHSIMTSMILFTRSWTDFMDFGSNFWLTTK